MKALLLSLLVCSSALADVEFSGPDWNYGQAINVTLQTLGLASDSTGPSKVALNFEGGRQIVLSGAHIPMGLALTSFQGKCLRVIPGLKRESVNIILTCPQ